MKTITILHPFSPKAAGVVEKSIPTYHSQPHVNAMIQLAKGGGYECRMEYFTHKLFGYTVNAKYLKWIFYPVALTLNGDHKKWKKQISKVCLKTYKKRTPDLTIINFSGHFSSFSFQLSKIIKKKNKHYVAMLGGQHYTDSDQNRCFYKNAHHILVHTKMQKQAMLHMDMFKDMDIRVFPLGVDCEKFKPLDYKTFKSDSPKLLYVGKIVEWKRVHLAIEAIIKLIESGFSNVQLKIIGPVVSENYYQSLQNIVKNFNLEEHVFFLGHKEYLELPNYYQQADLFMLPSDKETFGMVMIESMACGTPVAGMDCPGGPSDVISHLKDGIICTPENYSESIVSLFKLPDLLTEISKNARQKVLDEYSLNATYNVLKSSVEEITKLK